MKDLIYYVLIGGLFVFNAVSLFRDRKKNNFVYKEIFFSRHVDWLLALLLVASVIVFAATLEPYVPNFLKWSLFSLLDKDGTNANVEIMNQSLKISPILLIVIFVFLVLFLPKAAYFEEANFRYRTTKIDLKAVLTSFRFGLLHCLVGVPIWIGLILGIVGIVFCLKYIHAYKKTNDFEISLNSSTSLHGKYNIILIVLLMAIFLI